jgi:molybdopterin synthase sulfur carrier subunit
MSAEGVPAFPHQTVVLPNQNQYSEERMTINIPTPLRAYAAGSDCATVEAATVAQALNALTDMHPELRKHLFTPEGTVRSFVNLYLNDEDVRYLPSKEETVVTDEDTLSIIPSIAGGTGRPGASAFGD